MATRALRAYAVGSAFSVRDVEDQFAWRRIDFATNDYDYRKARVQAPRPASNRTRTRRAAAPVQRRIDPSKIRTPEERRAAALRAING